MLLAFGYSNCFVFLQWVCERHPGVKVHEFKAWWEPAVMHDTIIPRDNPLLKTGCRDPHGKHQMMVFPDNHPNEVYRGHPKGLSHLGAYIPF